MEISSFLRLRWRWRVWVPWDSVWDRCSAGGSVFVSLVWCWRRELGMLASPGGVCEVNNFIRMEPYNHSFFGFCLFIHPATVLNNLQKMVDVTENVPPRLPHPPTHSPTPLITRPHPRWASYHKIPPSQERSYPYKNLLCITLSWFSVFLRSDPAPGLTKTG